jgi:beta-1,4-mannosyl-glycoprotein beta-1,4-N-acetylglucosaminyltransferase
MIYDAFPFLNEFDMLEIRLNVLAPHVDRFVIVEANQTHSTLSGKDGFLFEKRRGDFKRFLDKIIYVRMDNEFETGRGVRRLRWTTRLRRFLTRYNFVKENEAFQRNAILRGLKDGRPDDAVLISDIDEIIDPACLARACAMLKEHPVLAFDQKMYRYFLNNREQDFRWTRARLTTCAKAFEMTPHGIRKLNDLPLVPEGGWHFSSVGSIEELVYKHQSYLHHDRCYKGRYRDPEALRALIEEKVLGQGVDIFPFMAEARYALEKIDAAFPAYLRDNRERFTHLTGRRP